MLRFTSVVAIVGLLLHPTSCFAPAATRGQRREQLQVPPLYSTNGSSSNDQVTRRQAAAALLSCSSIIAFSPLIATADTGAEVRGIPVNPFNGLAFNYRGSDFGGLKEEDIDEPSIPYVEFLEKLKAGEITFVEFKAPAGDAAYATFKDGKSIRVGEGYPIEQPKGYSSPAFAIRAVANAGVPYKFTVPNLQNYQAGVPQLRKAN